MNRKFITIPAVAGFAAYTVFAPIAAHDAGDATDALLPPSQTFGLALTANSSIATIAGFYDTMLDVVHEAPAAVKDVAADSAKDAKTPS